MIMKVSHALYWTLWVLSCFEQYLGQDVQFPELTNGAVGGSVVFTPDIPSSTSIFVILWQFGTTTILAGHPDSVSISPSYSDRVSFNGVTLSLELRNLRLNDSGTYSLTVSPAAGGELRGETSLQVFVNVSDVRLLGPEEPLIEGESANITSEGNGTITSIEWMKDNSPLSPGDRIIFSSDNRSVFISLVQRSDSGEYQCTYRNPFSSETVKLNLIVNYGPEDVSIMGLFEVDLGVQVSLSCSAVSVPSASFSWRFNDTDTGVTTDTFTIDKTEDTDSGDYICTAHNRVTNRTASQRHALLVKAGGGGGGGGGGLSAGAIAGIVIGVLVAVAGICGLIVYLIKSNKIPVLNQQQKGQAKGAEQNSQEPESTYETVIDSRKSSESAIYENLEDNMYVNVNHGVSNGSRDRPPQVKK